MSKAGIILLAAAAAALAGAARALEMIEPADPVPGHPGVTYLDLVRQAAPDLKPNDAAHDVEGHPTGTYRHIAGKVYQAEPPDPLVLGFIQDRRITVGGKRRIVILADLGQDEESVQSTALVLLFDDAPKPRLLDVADVSIDKDTEFAPDVGKPMLGPGDEAIVTYSEHLDASLAMGGYVLISPIGDRLRLIGLANVTSIKSCGWDRIESPKITVQPDPGHAHPRVQLTVRVKTTHTEGDCGEPIPRAGTRDFTARYRWNNAAGRYDTESSQFKALDALNGL